MHQSPMMDVIDTYYKHVLIKNNTGKFVALILLFLWVLETVCDDLI